MAGKQLPWNIPTDSHRGAPLGRPNIGGSSHDYIRLNCRMVPLHRGYDRGGAYWGQRLGRNMLFCIWSSDRQVVRYVDATTYLAAQEVVRRSFPQADFL